MSTVDLSICRLFFPLSCFHVSRHRRVSGILQSPFPFQPRGQRYPVNVSSLYSSG